MRRAARQDRNHADIASALASCGLLVQDLSGVGAGVADLLVCRPRRPGTMRAVECKDGKKSPSRRALTDAQLIWHEAWEGHVVVIKTVDEAIEFAQGLQ